MSYFLSYILLLVSILSWSGISTVADGVFFGILLLI